MTGWQTIKQAHPAPHRQYLVQRNQRYFVATPCYGMHAPWWVPSIATDAHYNGMGESDPVSMRPDDRWQPIPSTDGPPTEGGQ